MSTMKAKQIREMSAKDIGSKLSETRLELMKEVGAVRMGKPTKNTSKIRNLKKDVARMETIKAEMKRKATAK